MNAWLSRTRHPAWRIWCLAVVVLLSGCAAPSAQHGKQEAIPQVSTALVAPGLFELAYAEGRVYVTSAGADRRDGAAGNLLVLDAQTLRVLQAIESPEKPFALALNRRTGTLYVGHTMHRMISAYDVATMRRKGTVSLDGQDAQGRPYRGRQILVDEQTDTVYVSSPAADGPVWIIDGTALAIRARVPSAGGPGIGLDAERQRLYTSGKGFVSIIDVASRQIIQRIALDDKADRFLVNLEVDRERHRLYVTDSKHAEVLALSARDAQVLGRVPTGKGALALRLDAAGQTLYVTNRTAGSLAVVDAATLQVRQTIALPPYPNSLAFGENDATLFVSIKQPRDAKVQGYRDDRQESVARIRFDQ